MTIIPDETAAGKNNNKSTVAQICGQQKKI